MTIARPMISFDEQRRPALAPGVRLQTDKLTGEPVLVFPEGILLINSTAHDIVSRCDGKRTVAEILSVLAEEYEVEPEDLRGDVIECLADLNRRKLLRFAT